LFALEGAGRASVDLEVDRSGLQSREPREALATLRESGEH
jgi:hypothetical protein